MNKKINPIIFGSLSNKIPIAIEIKYETKNIFF
jgi:hypothetical protein